MSSVPGWPIAFHGSGAIAAGLVTPDRLYGPRFRRLLPDVYCAANAPADLRLRPPAACRLVEGRGVLVPAEVTVHGGGVRTRPGLLVPELMIGIECEGEVHTEPGRVLSDISRSTRLLGRQRQSRLQ